MNYKLVLFAFSALVFGVIIWVSNPAEIAKTISKADLIYVFIGLAVSTFSALLRVLKWHVLLSGVRFRSLLPVQILGVTISNFTPGKVAEPFKSVLLKAKENVSISSSMPSIVWERVVDVIVLILFSSLVILSVSGELVFAAYMSIAIFTAVIFFAVLTVRSRNFGTKVFAILRKLPVLKKLSDDFVKNFYSEKIKKRRLAMCFLVTVLVWTLDGIVFHLSLLSVGINIGPVVLMGIMAISTLIGVVSFLPGGIGSSEFVMLLLLSHLGAQQPVALSGIILMRLLTLWYFTFLGYLSFLYLTRKLHLDMSKIKI